MDLPDTFYKLVFEEFDYTVGKVLFSKEMIHASAINEVEPRNELLVYPNPATDQITVVFANQTAWESIMITDVSGKVVYTTPVNNDQITISVNGLEAGIYFITSISKSETAVQKLVVQ